MKVYIGPHREWIGPFQLAEKILFWLPKYNEKYEHNETVFKFGEWLAEDKNGNPSYLARFCEWIHSKKKRKVKIRIDDYDVWDMDCTLSMIILPMLKRLKDVKSGSPFVEMEDVPEHLRCEVIDHHDETVHQRWNWVLDEIIWAFTQKQPDSDWEEQFRSGNIDHKMVPYQFDENGKPTMYKMEDGPNHTYKCDYDGMREYEKRIQNGVTLFGKYYSGMWN